MSARQASDDPIAPASDEEIENSLKLKYIKVQPAKAHKKIDISLNILA